MSKANMAERAAFEALFFSRTNDYLNVYLTRQAGKSEYTRRSYRSALGDFYDYVEKVCGIPATIFLFSQCTYAFLLGYSRYLQEERHLKPGTVNAHIAAIRSYLGYATACDVSVSPAYMAARRVPLLTVPKVRQPIIEADDLRAFLDSPADTKTGNRDRFVLVFLFDTAMRVSELTAMTLGDITADGPRYRVLVHGKGRKERSITLSERCTEHLKAFLLAYHGGDTDPKSPLLYATAHGVRSPMSVRNVQRILNKYGNMARASLPSVPESVTPHTLRRTRATTMYRDGIPIEQVSAMLGHEEIETTRSHYASPSTEQMKKIVEKGSSNEPEQDAEWTGHTDEIKRKFGL